MAYIDKTKLLTDVDNGIKAGNFEEGYEQYQNINNMDDIIEAIEWADEEDVVERSEYEYLKKENRELAIKYDNAMNMVINEQENVTRLRSKIDKAIEEIEKEAFPESVYDEQCSSMSPVISVDAVVEILKRNIGE